MLNELMEIERRFLVDGRYDKPWRDGARVFNIQQHYVPFEAFTVVEGWMNGFGHPLTTMTEEEVDVWSSSTWVIRLRKMNEQHILTCKSRQSHDSSLELEWTVSKECFDAVLANGPFPHVLKTRYNWTAQDEHVWEIDEFEGALAGVVLAEIELSQSDQTFVTPEWVGHEVTGLESWSNNALSNMLSQKHATQG